MSEEMINLESHDTLGIKMADPIQAKLNECPQPPFFMDRKKALPFWLVRPLGDKMPMVSIPEKLSAPYTRGLVGENIVASLDPNKFVTLDPEGIAIEYKPLHDMHLKKFFKSPAVLKSVEKTGEVVDGKTVCSLKEYNEYRKFIHRLQLNYVSEQQRNEEELKVKQNDIDKFLSLSKKEGKERWNRKFNEYLKIKNKQALAQNDVEKKQKCSDRLKRVEAGLARVQEERSRICDLRRQKWLDYKRRMTTYFKNKQEAQRREAILSKRRWVLETVVNQHRKSLVQNENKLKREMKMEENWNRRMASQKLKLQKDELVRDQYNASIQLMRQRREKYYDSKDVEVDELLSLPGMNSLEELEIFNTQVDQFSPEFVSALRGSKFHINRSGKSLTLDKSLRKYIVHHESAAERMKKANVARPIKYALDLLIRRSVGYFAMVVTHNTVKMASEAAQQLAGKIRTSSKLRELLLEEYRQFGPRSDIPYQTLKRFDDIGLDHCMCDYSLVNKDALHWPCPICRKDKISPAESEWSSSITSKESNQEPEELYVIGEGTTTVGFLVPPKKQKGTDAELIIEEQKVDVEPLLIEPQRSSPMLPIPSAQPADTQKKEMSPKRKRSKSSLKRDMLRNIYHDGNEPSKSETASALKHSRTLVRKSSKTSASVKTSVSSRKFRPSVSKNSTASTTVTEQVDSKHVKRSKSRKGAMKNYQKTTDKPRPSRKLKRSKSPKKSSADRKQKMSKTKPITAKMPETNQSEVRKALEVNHESKTSLSSDAKKHRSKSILKVKSEKLKASQKNPAKGVSFAIDAKRAKLAKAQQGGKRAPAIETAPLVQSSNVHVSSHQNTGLKMGHSQGIVINNLEPESDRSRDTSIVSLLSITSDDRMRFVKGQCLFDKKRGSKLGKLSAVPQVSAKVKKGFVKGVCRCKSQYGLVEPDREENILGRVTATEPVMTKIKPPSASRWRGIKENDGQLMEFNVSRHIWPDDLFGVLEKLPHKKQIKLKYLMGAKDLVVTCLCEKCHGETPAVAEGEAEMENIRKNHCFNGSAQDSTLICKCRNQEKARPPAMRKADLLAHITNIIGDQRRSTEFDETSQCMKESSHKVSIRTMVERQKSIISKLVEKKTSEVVLQASQRKDPLVHKYYVDDRGDLYILNRRGQKTVLNHESKNFTIDGKGRKYFYDDTGKRYLVDVTGRVYLENEDGDVLSLFHEDGCQYMDSQPRKLLLHGLVRKSVLDLLQGPGAGDEVASNEDLVEMIYEYLFEGPDDDGLLASQGNDASRSEHDDLPDGVEESSKIEAEFVLPQNDVDHTQESYLRIATRMPIKRPLKSLINEVPFNHEISRLFIQKKKYHDCCAIVFRRCLLYSLAKYTQVIETGFDPLGAMDEKKRVTGLDGLVKGLTKITAHYPLNLIKSKQLAPYVDALVHGFIGTYDYYIFSGQNKADDEKLMRKESSDDIKHERENFELEPLNSVDSPFHISQVENLNSMRRYCFLHNDK